MNRFFILLSPLVTGATLLVSCERGPKEPPAPPVEISYEAAVTTSLDPLETRTALDGFDLTWSANDRIGVYYLPSGVENADIINRQFTATATAVGKKSGEFEATNKISFAKEATEHKLYAVYPYDQTGGANPAAIAVSIPAVQPQNAEGTFEWNGGFMVAETSVTLPEGDDKTRAEAQIEIKPQEVAFDLKYPFSIIELAFNGAGSEIESEEVGGFTLTSNHALVGDMTYDLASGLFTGVEGQEISVSFPEAKAFSGPFSAWLVVNPQEMGEDGKLDVGFDTADYSVSLSLETGVLAAGQIARIEVNIAELAAANKAEIEYTGELPAESNSYVVKPGEFAEISVSRAYVAWRQAVGNTELTGAITADIVWQTPQSLISDVTLLRGDKGERTVIKAQAAAETEGNALIGVYFDGVLKYAWHLWVTNADLTANTQSLNGFEIMDRNLGALSGTEGTAGTIGYYYEWGRNYPMGTMEPTDSSFPSYPITTLYDGSNTAVTFSNESTEVSAGFALQNPLKHMTNSDNWIGTMGNTSWLNENGAKGLFDPCPAGWRVPYLNADGESAWKNVSTSATGENKGFRVSSGRYRGWRMGTDPIFWYPSAGALTSSVSSISLPGTYGYYWLANPSASANASIRMDFMSSLNPKSSGTRREAYPIRCVKDSPTR